MTSIEKHQIQLQRIIDSRVSYMNTTKWGILFSIIKGVNTSYIAQVKLLLDDVIREFSIPNSIDQKYLEQYWGVFELKEIEWILIPSEIISERKNREELLSPKVKQQDVELITQAILETGKKFEYETSESGLIIYGYNSI